MNGLDTSLDGLRPGLLGNDALKLPGWVMKDGFLYSEEYGDLSTGYPYSFAAVENGQVRHITGKNLESSGQSVAKVGQSWKSVRTYFGLPPQERTLEIGDYGITFTTSDGVIEVIEFYNTPYPDS